VTKVARPVALVTGAAHRVGAAVALELAAAGFDLVLTCHTRSAELEITAQAARDAAAASGGACSVELHRVDFADIAAVGAFAAELAGRDRCDALIHNASVYEPSPLGSITDDELVRQYRVNAVAPLLLTQAAGELLRRSTLVGGGAVVCFSDIHVLGRPRLRFAAYSMSKAALTQMVEGLARELAPQVRVNAIAPGVVAWPDDTPAAERERYELRIPLRRPGTPEDAAKLVRWLVLDATYVTGEIIRLDGGRWLA